MKKRNWLISLLLLTLCSPAAVIANEESYSLSSSDIVGQISTETIDPSVAEDTSDSTTESTTDSSSLDSSETTGTSLDSSALQEIKDSVESKDGQSNQKFIDFYVAIISESDDIYDKKIETIIGKTNKLVNQTFTAFESFEKNGQTYYGLNNLENKLVGYVLSTAVEKVDGAQGLYHDFGKYITIKNPTGNVYWDFNWQVRFSSSKIQNKTYFAKAYYQHANGKKYYSFFDDNNKWQGYIDAADTEITSGKQGLPIGMNQYVTITSKHYKVWQNFNWKQLNHSSNMMNKIYQVRARYEHMNGSVYYSLYDWQGNWEGYINADATRKENGSQGPWIKDNKYVTVSKKNYNVWQNFNWVKKQSSVNLYNKTYQVKARYEHMNGETYYSLYDSRGAWQGYINSGGTIESNGAQGIFIPDNRYVTITKNNYNMWQTFNWQKKGNSKSFYQKTLRIKGHYNHFNGSTYYSLEDNKGSWKGYINSNAATVSSGPQGIYLGDGRILKVVNGNYNVWQNFNWKKKTSSKEYLNQNLVMKAKYNHFNGSTYYSMYDTSGNWKGYLNANATALPVTSRVIDSVPYVSQYTPVFAPWGCAGASMTMALRSKGVSIDLKYAMDNLPMYPQYAGGQIGNVYTGAGFQRVIQPQELTNYMKRWYSKVYHIPGASSKDITNHILDGNPVLYYGYSSYQVDKARNHVKVILGYKNNSFLIYDPLYYSKLAGPGSAGKHPIYDRGAMHWLSVSDFNKEYGGSAIVTK